MFLVSSISYRNCNLKKSNSTNSRYGLIENDPLPADTLETAHDKITSIAQELQEQVDRSIKLSRTNTMTSTEFTVGSSDRANKILAFDGSGEISVTQELGTFVGDWSASTTYNARDIVKDTSTNNIFICTTTHTSSGSQPLTTNTDSGKWSLLVDAASATSSATAAAASATAALICYAAANSASAASTSETMLPLLQQLHLLRQRMLHHQLQLHQHRLLTLHHLQRVLASASTATTKASEVHSATNAASSATSAASSATTATTKASEANIATNAASATTATTKASEASTSATNAASSATAADSAKTAAQAAQAAAETAADNFDDTYLGAKTSDPSTDNDGDALNAGDLYFNSNTNVLRVYNGSAWQDAAVDTTTLQQKVFHCDVNRIIKEDNKWLKILKEHMQVQYQTHLDRQHLY